MHPGVAPHEPQRRWRVPPFRTWCEGETGSGEAVQDLRTGDHLLAKPPMLRVLRHLFDESQFEAHPQIRVLPAVGIGESHWADHTSPALEEWRP